MRGRRRSSVCRVAGATHGECLESTIAIRPPVTYAMRRPSGAESREKLAAPRVSRRATFEERLITEIWIWPPREL